MKISKFLIFLFLIFQVLGCRSVETTKLEKPIPENDSIISHRETATSDKNKAKVVDSELEKHRNIWIEKKIFDYDMVLSGYQPGNVTPVEWALVKVRDDKIVSIEPSEPIGQITLKISIYKQFGTVNKMFDEIQKALENKTVVKIKYNKQFGYPENIDINYLLENDRSYLVAVKKIEIINKNSD